MAKKIVFRVILVVLALLFVALGGELVLRTLYAIDQQGGGDLQQRLERSSETEVGEEDGQFNMTGLVQASRFPDIVYEMKRNLDGRFRNKSIRSNSIGIRDDREFSVEKPENTYRIAGLGDSVMFGWSVNQDEPYLHVLNQRLDDLPTPHPKFEVMNFALPGYNTAMEVATFEHKALAYEPDLVVIHFVNNDLGVPMFMKLPKEPLSFRRSYFMEFIGTRLGWFVSDHRELDTHRLRRVPEEKKDSVREPYRYMLGRKGYRGAMKRLARLTEPRDIPVIILAGTVHSQNKKLLQDASEKHGFRIVQIRPYTDAWMKRHGIEDTPEARRKALWVSRADHHPNANAHPIYADAIMDEMGTLGIIPATAPDS